MYELINVK